MLAVLAILAGAWQQGATPALQSGDDVSVRAVRFYRSGGTHVDGFVRVPHDMLTPVTVGANGFAAFRLDVSVVDQAGTVLTQDGWTRTVPWTAQETGASSVEPLAFSLAPGGYTIRVTVRDSASGRGAAAQAMVAGYPARPGASDLLLAYSVRQVQPGDTAAAPGELRKGQWLVAAGPDLQLTPTQATVAFYCEVYRDSAAVLPWRLQVIDAAGKALLTTAPAQTGVAAGGGVLTGSVDLTGLPPGAYKLALLVGAGGDTVSRSAAFRVGGFEAERHVASVTQANAESRDPFALLSEAQLDTLYTPLVLLASPGDLGLYRGLSVEGKRRFLRDFWHNRDASDVERPAFYQKIKEADQLYAEGRGASVPGWRTDRGRIYVLYGAPDDVLNRPSSGTSYPWVLWKYTKTRVLYYLFVDRTRLGNYDLVYSTDRHERTMPNWQSYFDDDTLREIQSF